MNPSYRALMEVSSYIKNNYHNLVNVIQEQVTSDRIIIKTQIANKSKEDSIEFHVDEDGILTLEISTSGIKILNKNSNVNVAVYYETVESLFESIIPNTWFKYFEKRIMDAKLQK